MLLSLRAKLKLFFKLLMTLRVAGGFEGRSSSISYMVVIVVAAQLPVEGNFFAMLTGSHH